MKSPLDGVLGVNMGNRKCTGDCLASLQGMAIPSLLLDPLLSVVRGAPTSTLSSDSL